MTIAEFVNKIVATLPGVVFTSIEDWEFCFASIQHAHHSYGVSFTDKFEVSEMTDNDTDLGEWKKTNFSNRIEGLLNGLKRNEAGEMVKVGVCRG